MRFQPMAGESVCELEVPERFQSWEGMVHGGVVALMLDEAMGWAGWHAGHPGVTGRLQVRYREPLRVGERVRVAARVERVHRSLIYAAARIDRADGACVAEATATLMAVPTTVSSDDG